MNRDIKKLALAVISPSYTTEATLWIALLGLAMDSIAHPRLSLLPPQSRIFFNYIATNEVHSLNLCTIPYPLPEQML